jgi:hypothetical protein
MKSGHEELTRKVKIADAKFGPWDMDRQEDLAAAAEVLDIAVAAMLRSPGDGTSPLGTDASGRVWVRAAGVAALSQWRQRHVAVQAVGRNELALAPVPLGQHLRRRRAPEDARVDEPRELDMRNVS